MRLGAHNNQARPGGENSFSSTLGLFRALIGCRLSFPGGRSPSWEKLALTLRLGELPCPLSNSHRCLRALESAHCVASENQDLCLRPQQSALNQGLPPDSHQDGTPKRNSSELDSTVPAASAAPGGAVELGPASLPRGAPVARPTGAMGSEVAQLLEAADFAAHKHRRQRRMDPEGTPYINHPIGGRAAPAVTSAAPGDGGGTAHLTEHPLCTPLCTTLCG